MSAPNILSLTTIAGKTAVAAVTTSAADLIDNPSSSGRCLKVVSLFALNITGGAASVTLRVNRASTNYHLAKDLPLPPGAPLVVISRDAPIYLEEGDKVTILAGANSTVEAVASFEELA